MTIKRVLAFGCHPDDIEFMAAGTLILLSEKGSEIHLATMSGGEVGSPTLTNQQIRAKRLKEAETSARAIGAQYHYAGGFDLQIEYNAEYRKMAVRVMREVNPDIVLTCPPVDYLVDHEITSCLVRNAAFIASVPLFDCGLPIQPMKKIPYLYYWDAVGGKDNFGRPLPVHCGVDISSVIDKKEKMLACHDSQAEWLRFINGWDAYTENMKQYGQHSGRRIGRQYGECFIQHLGNGYPQDNILNKILGDLCIELEEV